jgi:hypothetical protein
MKTIQFFCMTVLLCLVFTACEKDNFTLTSEDPVLPHLGILDSVDSPDMWAAEHHTKSMFGEDRIVPSTLVRISSKVKATIIRQNGRLAIPGDTKIIPDMDSKTYNATNDEIMAYTISGSGEAINEVVGWAAVSLEIQSNYKTRELTGLISMASLSEKGSMITFRAWGYPDLQPIDNSTGVSFRLEVLSASGRYAGIAKFANGTLCHFTEDLYSHHDNCTALLTINAVYEPVLSF